jgi:hypothetical protein
MTMTRTIFVLIYYEAPEYVEPLGVFNSMAQAKAAGNEHFGRYHVGAPDWKDEELGSRATHKSAYYLARELELVEH